MLVAQALEEPVFVAFEEVEAGSGGLSAPVTGQPPGPRLANTFAESLLGVPVTPAPLKDVQSKDGRDGAIA
jgi:hypothetical protein